MSNIPKVLEGSWFNTKLFLLLESKTDGVVSIDPGLKSYLTFYAPDYGYGYIGNNMKDMIMKQLLLIDKRYSIVNDTSIKSKIRKKLKKTIDKNIKKLSNKLEEINWKAANYLVGTFKLILLPDFKFSTCYNFKNKETNNILLLTHKNLYKILLKKCKENHSYVKLVDESFSTVTCSTCKNKNKPIDRVYECGNCGLKICRDINACINIYNNYQDSNIHKICDSFE